MRLNSARNCTLWISSKQLRIVVFVATLIAVVGLQLRSQWQIYAQTSGPCAPPIINPIPCENSQAGNPPSEWQISGFGDPSIQGFATDISVNKGGTVHFKIDTDAMAYQLDIYRMGYYGGDGARKVATVSPSASLPQNQPDCLTDASTGLIDCGNWTESASWSVPATAVSGIYFAKLVRTDTGGSSHIVFVVRDDSSSSDLLFQTSDTTWQAYNEYGGNSLYVGGPGTSPGRAYKVSYNRPFITQQAFGGRGILSFVFGSEYPMVRWLEANGYHVSYFSGVDTDRFGNLIQQHKVFMSVGHDEYWSGNQRANVEAARNAGVNLAFFSGNEIFWKTRSEPSIDGSNTPYRTLVSYKETHANQPIDPQDPPTWTGTWRDPRFSPPADGGRPENALSGTIFTVNCCRDDAMNVSAEEGRLWFWRNTGMDTLPAGQIVSIPGMLGVEWDEDLDNGARPAGLIKLSSTTVSLSNEHLQDFGSTYGSGVATHSLTLYRHASGALVFGAGTMQWPWSLDANHDDPLQSQARPDVGIQQATVNLLADMGTQPATLQMGANNTPLVLASQSTDTTPPTSSITSPTNGATVPTGSFVIKGTATDTGGGIVAGVEVSVDGGATWQLASGTTSWSYTWTPGAAGTVTIKSRAFDDRGNVQTSSSSVTATVVARQCPCSLWSDATTPATPDVADSSAVEVGLRFRADQAGYITGIRFYKGTGNTGTHVGNLWSNSGALLSTVTFTNETASGWQQATFPSAIAISANTTYVVSYHTTTGHYAGDASYFALSSFPNAPLTALKDGVDGGNGVYLYGAGGFPTLTFGSTNYWVDVVFNTTAPVDTTPPSVSSVSPPSGATDVDVGFAMTVTFSEAMDPATISSSTFVLRDPSNTLVPATVTYQATTLQAKLTPTAALAATTTYTALVKGGAGGVKDVAGNPMTNDYSWSFTTGTPLYQGSGGPILLISSSSDPFTRYYAEILRAEGFNSFATVDLPSVSATTLASYDVVILGAMPLTASQVTMFTNWVNAGGNLITMRPDKQLAPLLGLTDAAATLANAYQLVNAASGPGASIVNQTIQFKGVADRYTLNGATSIATLYSDAATATANPAVTLRSVGSNGGQAAAFTYDLARSIVYLHQGNPAWSGQERDGFPPIRPDDLYYGNASGDPQSDWIDLNKVAIPQADEAQRLLANLLLQMNLDKKPLPRFWYFPRGFKAVVIMTGQDPGIGDTTKRFDQYVADSPANCSVADWDCIRGTSYVYPNTPLTGAQVATYNAAGFEIGIFVTTGCANWTPASLDSFYSDQLTSWAAAYPSLPAPVTSRIACVVWSDYGSQPQVELNHGIRLDANYYYWPPSWVADRPGFFTGSGMPMRFAAPDGTMIDVYQATTQLTAESGQTYPDTINSLLDNALGAQGYYGAFTANIPMDATVSSFSATSDAIVASAQAHGVPIVSAKQMLTWLDSRNSSSFGSLNWNTNSLSFTITAGGGATNLQAMVPMRSITETLTGVTRNGASVSYTTQTIKGIDYAFFPAVAGAYQATYGGDTTAPTVTSVTPANGATGVSRDTTVTATFSEAMTASTITTSTFQLRNAATNTVIAATVNYDSGTNTAMLTPNSVLASNTTYTATVTGGASGVKDVAGNALAVTFTWTFTTAADTTAPTVTSVTPANGATNVATSTTVTATFSEAMDPTTITTTTVLLGAGGTSQVTATVNYDVNTHMVTLTPSTALISGTTYTATVVGGANGVKDVAGNALATTFTWTFTTVADTTAPTVTSVTPANGATNVATSTTVTATFSEAMDPTTINTTTVTLSVLGEAASPVSAAVSYDANTHTVTLTPIAALAFGTTYTAMVVGGTNGVKDVAGNALAVTFTWTFTTVADTTAPTVTSVTPANGATNVATSTTVTATFSEAMTASTITTGTFQLRNAATNTVIAATVSYDPSTNTATVTPNSALASNTTYRARVVGGANGVKDVAGNALAVTFTWTFATVADTTAPTVTSVTPANGATNVATSTTVTATFSEAMTASTITTGTFQLRNAATNTVIAATVSYDPSTNTATVTPNSALASNTTYTATVVGGTNGVKDVAGNALATTFTWTFTTASTANLGLTSIGNTLDSGDSNDLNGSKITTSSGGNIVSMSVYVGNIDSKSTNRQYQLAIYTDNAGKPGALVAKTATGTLTANAWNTLPITATLQANTSYWLVYNTNGRTPAVNNMYYNTSAAGQGVFSTKSFTFGTWPTTFPASALTTGLYSLYATSQ